MPSEPLERGRPDAGGAERVREPFPVVDGGVDRGRGQEPREIADQAFRATPLREVVVDDGDPVGPGRRRRSRLGRSAVAATCLRATDP